MSEIDAIRKRWEAATPGPWHWNDQPDGVIRVWFSDAFSRGYADSNVIPPKGYEPTIACLIFPGDMETYEGPDLRLADAIAAAPQDIKTLLARIGELETLLRIEREHDRAGGC